MECESNLSSGWECSAGCVGLKYAALLLLASILRRTKTLACSAVLVSAAAAQAHLQHLAGWACSRTGTAGTAGPTPPRRR